MRRPIGIFWLAVLASEQIFGDAFEAVAVFREKMSVVQVGNEQHMTKAQHQRNVTVGPAGQPFGVQQVGRIVPDRADADEVYARLLQGAQMCLGAMTADAAGTNLIVF